MAKEISVCSGWAREVSFVLQYFVSTDEMDSRYSLMLDHVQDGIDSLSMEIIKTRLDTTLSNLLWLTLPEQGLGLEYLKRHLSPFCDSVTSARVSRSQTNKGFIPAQSCEVSVLVLWIWEKNIVRDCYALQPRFSSSGDTG